MFNIVAHSCHGHRFLWPGEEFVYNISVLISEKQHKTFTVLGTYCSSTFVHSFFHIIPVAGYWLGPESSTEIRVYRCGAYR